MIKNVHKCTQNSVIDIYQYLLMMKSRSYQLSFVFNEDIKTKIYSFSNTYRMCTSLNVSVCSDPGEQFFSSVQLCDAFFKGPKCGFFRALIN